MDVRTIGSPSIRESDSHSGGKSGEIGQTSSAAGDRLEVSALGAEWRGRVRVLDGEIRTFQDSLSRTQLRQDGLVDMQTELLEYTGDNFPAVRESIRTLSRNIRYNGEPILADFELKHEAELYEFGARLEVEKNRTIGEKTGLTRELKAAAVTRENVILAGAGTSLQPPEKFLEELRSYARELNRASFLDQARIRDLLG